jgi:primosomal protein N' (replication factor Y)
MNYPPFGDVFMVMATCNDEKRLLSALNELGRLMRHYNRKGYFEILGPAPAMVRKVNNVFRWKILIKSTADTERREILLKFVFYCVERLKSGMDTGGININLTLNPKVLA